MSSYRKAQDKDKDREKSYHAIPDGCRVPCIIRDTFAYWVNSQD